MATLRRDGSPRISGTEATFHEGELWWGSMPNAVKARDLRRDPRFALHSGSEDPPDWRGDAKIAGRAEEVLGERRGVVLKALGAEPEGDSHLFRADVTELSVVQLNKTRTKLVITSWSRERGLQRIER